jgi:uncharacterized protein with beta-barrel porin domain
VQSGASVSGNTGFVLNTNNTINNLGTIGGTLQFGINSTGNVSVVNSGGISAVGDGILAGGTVNVTNNAGGTIHGSVLDGISAATVNGTNAGTISGGFNGNGIQATTVTITNSNTISGSLNGIIATGAANVTNNGGTIQGTGSGLSGISAGTDVTVVNSGAISGDGIGIKAAQSATVTNNGGTITGAGSAGQFGISAGTNAVVVNSGSITGTGDGILAGGTVNVTNNVGGTIHGSIHNGISGTTVNGTNAGTISGTDNGINATTVTVTNSNMISGLGSGIIATGAANVTNNGGTIQGTGSGLSGISAGTDVTVVNSGAISGDGIGIKAAQSATVTNNGGTITGAGSAGQFGVSAGTNATVVNSGSITGTGDGVTAGSIAIVTNNLGGTIHGNIQNGVSGAAVIGTNAGTISGFNHGILASGAGSNFFNSGTITGNSGTAVQFAGANNVLTLGPGSIINGLVTGGATNIFQLGGTGSDTFNAGLIGAAQQYRNFTTFNKVGTSTWTLTGTFGQANPWTVQGGTLSVNGDLSAASGVTVNTGGTLGGTGTLPATVIASGGTLAPGNSIGTITVNGNLTFNAGSTYLVEVSPSAADRTNVTGTASLAGTVNAAFAPGSYVSRSYTILSAAGGLGGTTFNALTTNNSNFSASLGYTSTDVLLNLTAALGGGQQRLPRNQQNVADAINGFFNGGGTLPPGFGTLFGLTGDNLSAGLSQVSGEAATGAQLVAFQLMNEFLGLMLYPPDDRRGAIGGAASAFASEQTANFPSELTNAYAAVLKAPASRPLSLERRWSAWAAGFGGYNTTSGDAIIVGSHDVTARTYGVAAGIDYRVTPDTVVGFALAGAGTNWGLAQGLGGGRSDAFQAGLYGKTHIGAAYVNAALAFANHWMSTDRYAFGGDHLTAGFNAYSLGGRIEAGYRYALPVGAITPYAALQAQSFHSPGYSETDLSTGGFGLSYASRSATDTRSELGARFDKQIAVAGDKTLTLRASLAWAHDWISDPSLTAIFLALPGSSFIVNGAAPAEDSALVSAGAEFRLANGVSMLAKFNGEFGGGSQTYSGTGTLRYTW